MKKILFLLRFFFLAVSRWGPKREREKQTHWSRLGAFLTLQRLPRNELKEFQSHCLPPVRWRGCGAHDNSLRGLLALIPLLSWGILISCLSNNEQLTGCCKIPCLAWHQVGSCSHGSEEGKWPGDADRKRHWGQGL